MYQPLMDLRRYCYDLCAVITDWKGSKSEKLRSFPSEMTAIKALWSLQKDGWHVLTDPSEFLSFETVARPLRQHKVNGIPFRNIGIGNTRMQNATLFYSVVLLEAKLEETTWSKDTGMPRFQNSITLRLHTSRFQIHYGSTAAEHKCSWSMAPEVERNPKLLQTWPPEEYKYQWEAPKKLDKWHKMWYQMDTCGHVLQCFMNTPMHLRTRLLW